MREPTDLCVYVLVVPAAVDDADDKEVGAEDAKAEGKNDAGPHELADAGRLPARLDAAGRQATPAAAVAQGRRQQDLRLVIYHPPSSHRPVAPPAPAAVVSQSARTDPRPERIVERCNSGVP